MLEEVVEAHGFLNYTFNITQHKNDLWGWIISVGLGLRVGVEVKEGNKRESNKEE